MRLLPIRRTARWRAAENAEQKLYAIQFHPEVLHTAEGTKMINNFVKNVCECAGDWKMDAFVENSIKANPRKGRRRKSSPCIIRRCGFFRGGRPALKSYRKTADMCVL